MFREGRCEKKSQKPRENEMKKAVALLYDPKKGRAPLVTASGKGEIARKILSIAGEAGIPVREDAELVEILAKVPVGDEIPEELYQAVAEILAFIYRLNQKQG